ncbi:twin-arginine translocation pathway signal protein [Alteromonas sp. KUL42]|uniref:gluconate 2-dehydrogenase subunit 3 family protein n=1 Tax=Alteromonas sp. KUL42 TaxID=2480797 RepID=UPI001036A5B3|nr:gluconate 2-dehydrogenase subunit 3 family protein [Alteromonas sp. KUL42]TAP35198.1 gluconate 2-dehydrogenase subunit 3 family protein [Alteromonas sp. KUL42]GEA07495.1 twin-arginine translocation pathway signal protein [Alteromonas sp. KUL42]
MERRELLKLIATATGTALFAGSAFAYKDIAPVPLSDTLFSKDDVALLNEMAEVIIPQTDTPGAKAANVGATMAVLITDCYTPLLQKTFMKGLKAIDEVSKAQFDKHFLQLSTQQRETLFNQLDVEAKAANLANGVYQGVETGKPSQWEPGTDEPTPHYFTLLKQLTLYCFFTSKVGATKVLRYVAIPGRYDGAYPYKKGDKAWAT